MPSSLVDGGKKECDDVQEERLLYLLYLEAAHTMGGRICTCMFGDSR